MAAIALHHKIKWMLIVEHTALRHLKNIIQHKGVLVDIYEHASGKLAVSATLEKPGGVIYFSVLEKALTDFVFGLITLQELFDKSPSHFTEICDHGITRLYMRYDIEIKLKSGDKKYTDFLPPFKRNTDEKPTAHVTGF